MDGTGLARHRHQHYLLLDMGAMHNIDYEYCGLFRELQAFDEKSYAMCKRFRLFRWLGALVPAT